MHYLGRSKRSLATLLRDPTSFVTWYWALVPLLAIIAYASALGVGFLMDDYRLLTLAQEPGIDAKALLPFPDSAWVLGFYRPISILFSWELGWHLWGFNPLPYHVTGLLLHACCALVLGLWLAGATGRRGLGWLAGALFAVYPLHQEAVAWLATQWDALATLFGLLSLWAFTVWWRSGRRSWWLYMGSIALYGLAIFTKESLFTFLLIPGVAAWYVLPPRGWREWRTLVYALALFGVPIGINVGLRLVINGTLGNYPTARSDISSFFWDSLSTYVRVLLAPINPAVMGNMWVQVIGVMSSVAILVGLSLWGRSQGRLLLLAAIWIVVTIVPVLNSPFLVKSDDLQNNRYLYLPAVGYCVGVAALLYAAISVARKWRTMAVTGIWLVLVVCIGLTWMQLQPWLRSSAQAREITRSLQNLIPQEPRQHGMVWYAEGLPYAYKGAYMLYIGLGLARVLTYGGGDFPNVNRLPNAELLTAAEAPISEEERDAFAFRLAYYEPDDLFHVDYIAGVTGSALPPSVSESGEALSLWDFRDCAPGVFGKWQVDGGASLSCVPQRGLVVKSEGDNPQLIGPPIEVRPEKVAGEFVRLRVEMSYSAGQVGRSEAKWYWHGVDEGFSQEHARSLKVRADGKSRVYWTFLPTNQVGDALTGLRLEPGTGRATATIGWIAIDVVR